MEKHGRRILFLLMAAFFAVNIWVFMLGQNEVINIVEFEVYSDKVESPVTIAQLSDLHEKSFGRDNSDLFETVRSVRPDLIVITGDIIYNSYTDSPNLPYMENLAKGCAEIAPTFFITGNHARPLPPAGGEGSVCKKRRGCAGGGGCSFRCGEHRDPDRRDRRSVH